MASVKSIFILFAFLLCAKLSIARRTAFLVETSSTIAGYNNHTAHNKTSFNMTEIHEGNGDGLASCRYVCPVCGACLDNAHGLDDHHLGLDQTHGHDEGNNGDVRMSSCRYICPVCGACVGDIHEDCFGKKVWPFPSAMNETVNGGKKKIAAANKA